MRKLVYGFLKGPTQIRMYNHERWLEVEEVNGLYYVAKTKALICFLSFGAICFRICKKQVFS